MKKQNILYTLLFCMMAMVVSFASCSDDDDNNSSQGGDASSIVGTWADEEDRSDVYVFSSDGTWVNRYTESDGSVWIESGTYQYNESSKTLTMTWTYTNDPDDADDLPQTDVFTVVSISKDRIVLGGPERIVLVRS